MVKLSKNGLSKFFFKISAVLIILTTIALVAWIPLLNREIHRTEGQIENLTSQRDNLLFNIGTYYHELTISNIANFLIEMSVELNLPQSNKLISTYLDSFYKKEYFANTGKSVNFAPSCSLNDKVEEVNKAASRNVDKINELIFQVDKLAIEKEQKTAFKDSLIFWISLLQVVGLLSGFISQYLKDY